MSVLGHILGICLREFGGRSLVGLRKSLRDFKGVFRYVGLQGAMQGCFSDS